MTRTVQVVVERHPECFIAYPLGLKGAVVAQGQTEEQVLKEIHSAIRFHIDTFGTEELESNEEILEVRVAQTEVAI